MSAALGDGFDVVNFIGGPGDFTPEFGKVVQTDYSRLFL